jgi:hypothetical protein
MQSRRRCLSFIRTTHEPQVGYAAGHQLACVLVSRTCASDCSLVQVRLDRTADQFTTSSPFGSVQILYVQCRQEFSLIATGNRRSRWSDGRVLGEVRGVDYNYASA